jgi:hypothetical protein
MDMIKTKVLFSILVSLFCLFAPMANAEMSSTSYRISTTVMSGGGGIMSSVNFNLVSTVAQSSPLGYGSSGNYQLDPGYWYTVLIGFVIGDINGNGVADLEDVIIALQIVTGQSPASIFVEADVDGDGRIGIIETIMILRKLGGLTED